LGGMFAMTRRVQVIHRWVDGPDVLTWFEPSTSMPQAALAAPYSAVPREIQVAPKQPCLREGDRVAASGTRRRRVPWLWQV
jgi:hypothetical protein